MPFYDYKCEKCGHIEKDVRARMSDKTKKCPKCGGTMKRMVSKGFFKIDGKRGKLY